MAKKNSRSDQPASPTNLPSPDRRRTVRATTRKTATADEVHAPGNGAAPPAAPTYEQIAEAAYHRYLQRGGHHGNDFDDWLDAERSLRSRSQV
jgi:hypothetical protein